MEPARSPGGPGLDIVRRLRAEMFDAIAALLQALAAPAVGRTPVWRERVRRALSDLDEGFRQHVAATEAAGGLHDDLVATEPRLSHAVWRLAQEHDEIRADLDQLLAAIGAAQTLEDAEATRDAATTLIGRLARHRQRGADLIYEAYETDIGGET